MEAIIISLVSILIFIWSLIFISWQWWYNNPKLKKIAWCYSSPKSSKDGITNFFEHLIRFRKECDGFLKSSIETIGNDEYQNQYQEAKIPLWQSAIYSPVVYQNKQNQKFYLIVEATNFGYRFWVAHKSGIKKSLLRNLDKIYERNEWSHKK